MSINSNTQNLELDTKRHSFAHLMAAAVGQMFPEAQYGVGPVIENGCYYDFVLPRNLIPEDLPILEKKIKEMLKQDLRFKCQELSLEDAINHFYNANQPLKVELLENLRDQGTTSMSEEEKADFALNVDLESLLKQALAENKRIICDAVIFNKEGKTFTQKRSANRLKHPNCWDLVGGHLEVGESLEACLEREVREEIGCEIKEFELIDILDFECHPSMLKEGEISQARIFRFLVNLEDEKIILEEGKAVEYRWLQQDELDITLENRSEKNGVTYIRDSLQKGFDYKNQSKTPKITIYRIVNEKTGEVLFEDLCKGPHVFGIKSNQANLDDLNLQNLGFKLDKFSAAYWRGDQERGINMQRLYALVFETKDELKEFITQREEAKKRDHRILGSSLKLFTISELVGSGFPLFQPKGATIRKLLEDYLWQLQKHSHQRVYTPHLTKKDLYDVSGHSGKYLDDMFSVYGGTSKENFYVKPMNCPMHMQIFDDNQFSYKDMPVRYFDPTTVYRDEKTGQLSGLTRVRSITQDDGHVFCRIGQIQEEFTLIVRTIHEFFGSLGMVPDWVSWSVRDPNTPDKYLGETKNWEIAEEAIRKAAEANGLAYERKEGEAAFYGPKLDFVFKDCIGREWQLSTIQCDFVQPERFDLSFTNEHSERERPVVIHRAILGSFERFMGILIEHFAGKFPFWLAPEQIRILTINDEVLPYVNQVEEVLKDCLLMKPLKYNEIRYNVDSRAESLGKKIREAKLDKTPMLIVLGQKDVEANEVSIEYNGESIKVGLAELKGWIENVK